MATRARLPPRTVIVGPRASQPEPQRPPPPKPSRLAWIFLSFCSPRSELLRGCWTHIGQEKSAVGYATSDSRATGSPRPRGTTGGARLLAFAVKGDQSFQWTILVRRERASHLPPGIYFILGAGKLGPPDGPRPMEIFASRARVSAQSNRD